MWSGGTGRSRRRLLVVGGNLSVLWTFFHVCEATRVVGHYTMVAPGDSSWAGRVWEATDVGWLACRACGRGWGPRRGLRVVWRAVGGGILTAGANGGTARRRTAVSARIGTKRRCRGGGVPGACGMASTPPRPELICACTTRPTSRQSLVRHRVRKHRAAKQSLRSSYPVHSRTAEARARRRGASLRPMAGAR